MVRWPTAVALAPRWLCKRSRGVGAFLLVAACGPHPSAEALNRIPRLALAPPAPPILARSAEEPPAWLTRSSDDEHTIYVVGQGSAPTREEARSRAAHTLFEAVGAMVAHQVRGETEITETLRVGLEGEAHNLRIRQTQQAVWGPTLRRLQPDAEYWEHRGGASGDASNPTYYYALRAPVPIRLLRLLQYRHRVEGRTLILVESEQGAQPLATEVGLILAAQPNLAVVPPEVCGPGCSDEERDLLNVRAEVWVFGSDQYVLRCGSKVVSRGSLVRADGALHTQDLVYALQQWLSTDGALP